MDIYVKVVRGRKKWLTIPLPLISLKWMFKQTLLLLTVLQLQLSGLCKKTNAESFITVNCWSFLCIHLSRCIICSTKTFQGLIIFPLWKVKQKLLYVTQVFNLMLCWCIYLCIVLCIPCIQTPQECHCMRAGMSPGCLEIFIHCSSWSQHSQYGPNKNKW